MISCWRGSDVKVIFENILRKYVKIDLDMCFFLNSLHIQQALWRYKEWSYELMYMSFKLVIKYSRTFFKSGHSSKPTTLTVLERIPSYKGNFTVELFIESEESVRIREMFVLWNVQMIS